MLHLERFRMHEHRIALLWAVADLIHVSAESLFVLVLSLNEQSFFLAGFLQNHHLRYAVVDQTVDLLSPLQQV